MNTYVQNIIQVVGVLRAGHQRRLTTGGIEVVSSASSYQSISFADRDSSGLRSFPTNTQTALCHATNMTTRLQRRPHPASGRRATAHSANTTSKKRQKTLDLSGNSKNNDDDDDNSSVSSREYDSDKGGRHSESDDDQHDRSEPLEVKKVRLAREYLDSIARRGGDDESNSDSDEEDEEDDDDPVARKLQKQRLQQAGTWKRSHADALQRAVTDRQASVAAHHAGQVSDSARTAAAWWSSPDHDSDEQHVRLCRGHDLTPTCVALSSSTNRAVSGSKDHSVLLWDVATETKLVELCPRWNKKQRSENRAGGVVGAVAISDDGRFVAVGRHDATVPIYDVRADTMVVQTLTGHKGPITGLAFGGAEQLFTASTDRCIRHYNIKDRLYLETLYGHQSSVTGLDCYSTATQQQPAPVSVGADRTARWWKLAQDTHCIYRGGSKWPAADAIAALHENWFVTGHVNGTVALWKTDKKRPIAQVMHCPNDDNNNDPAPGEDEVNAGVVSLACIRGSDVVASGSSDGWVRFWKADVSERALEPLCQIPVHGFVNGLAIHSDATYAVAAVGQEHRSGRWQRIPRAKNRLAILKLQPAAAIEHKNRGTSSLAPDSDHRAAESKGTDRNEETDDASSASSESANGDKGIDYEALD